jgi:hypothetical protein
MVSWNSLRMFITTSARPASTRPRSPLVRVSCNQDRDQIVVQVGAGPGRPATGVIAHHANHLVGDRGRELTALSTSGRVIGHHHLDRGEVTH